MHIDDTEELGGNAPRPIDADSVAPGTFATLEKGQGAKSAKHAVTSAAHASAQAEPFANKKLLIGLVVGALVAIVLIVTAIIRVLDAPAPEQAPEPVVEQTKVAADETIEYRGVTYALIGGLEGSELAEMRDGNEFVSLGEVPGDPVALILYDGAIMIPENLSDGTWDVIAYTIGSGWTQIADQQGEAQTGQGAISEASLDGTTLKLVVDGQTQDIPLVW